MRVFNTGRKSLLTGAVLCCVIVFLFGCFAMAEQSISEPSDDGLTRQCLECGESVPKEDKYCGTCGIEMGRWKCTRCGRTNSERNNHCAYCNEKQHEPGKYTMTEKADETGGYWICANCQAWNTFDDQYCPDCGKTRCCAECGLSFPKGNQYCGSCGTEAGRWKCAHCGETNSKEDNYCIYCAEIRHEPGKGLTTVTDETDGYWICSNCQAQNTFDDHYCAECGETQYCFECGISIPKKDKYCRNCGTDLGHWTCSNCGDINESSSTYCGHCGTNRHKPEYPDNQDENGEEIKCKLTDKEQKISLIEQKISLKVQFHDIITNGRSGA